MSYSMLYVVIYEDSFEDFLFFPFFISLVWNCFQEIDMFTNKSIPICILLFFSLLRHHWKQGIVAVQL